MQFIRFVCSLSQFACLLSFSVCILWLLQCKIVYRSNDTLILSICRERARAQKLIDDCVSWAHLPGVRQTHNDFYYLYDFCVDRVELSRLDADADAN